MADGSSTATQPTEPGEKLLGDFSFIAFFVVVFFSLRALKDNLFPDSAGLGSSSPPSCSSTFAGERICIATAYRGTSAALHAHPA